MTILFTCLAFYYDDLTLSQLRQSLEYVLKSDDSSREYDRWTHDLRSLSNSLREWNAINVEDDTQLKKIWQHVRYNVIVIDYFINNFVFSIYVKQFHMKLQTSDWDISLFSTESLYSISSKRTLRSSLTTSFSEINDNRTMLSLNIKQKDLSELSHINVEILIYLLRNRSRLYVLAANDREEHLSEIELIHKMNNMSIRVLIDAEAQILKMNNFDLTKAWLAIDYQAQTAVYFDVDNKSIVLYRQDHQISLLTSSFAKNLNDCLIYLDEAHTRDTNLKMLSTTCEVLTLSLDQTKDQTVQDRSKMTWTNETWLTEI